MHKAIASCLMITALYATGQLATAQVQTDEQANKNLIGTAVVLRTLDKVTATTQDYTLKIGETLDYGSLTITARHCEKKPPTEIPETYAFLQVTDTRLNGQGDVLNVSETDQNAENENMIFSGWMFASKPAISALDHRVYDVWVIDCKLPESVNNLRR